MTTPRPLPCALIALTIGIAAAPAAGEFGATNAPAVAAMGLFLVIAWGGALARRPALTVAALLVCVGWFGVISGRRAASPAPDDVSRHAAGPSVRVLGMVESPVEVRAGGRQRFTLRVRAVNDYRATRPASGRLLVHVAAAARGGTVEYGSELWLRGRIRPPARATNPGAFDHAAFLARRGVFSILTVRRPDDVRPTGRRAGGSWAGAAGAWLRHAIQAATARHLPPDDAALLDGLLLSIRGRMDPLREDAFARTGTAHVLSTSGLHLAVLAGFLAVFSRALSLSRGPANLGSVAVIWVYALAAGAGPAVVRSAIMISVLLAAPLLRRNADPLNSLAVAAFAILLHAPLALYDAGTQISFATVAALLLWLPVLERLVTPWEPGMGRRARLLHAVLTAFLVGAVAQAGSWPLVAWHFHLFSVVAPLANPPVGFLTGLLLLAGLGAVALTLLPALGVVPVWPLLGGGLHLLSFLVTAFASVPFAAVSAAPPPPAFLFGYYVLLGGGAVVARELVLRRTLFTPPARPAADLPALPRGGRATGVAAGTP